MDFASGDQMISHLPKFSWKSKVLGKVTKIVQVLDDPSSENFTINLKVLTEIWHIRVALRGEHLQIHLSMKCHIVNFNFFLWGKQNIYLLLIGAYYVPLKLLLKFHLHSPIMQKPHLIAIIWTMQLRATQHNNHHATEHTNVPERPSIFNTLFFAILTLFLEKYFQNCEEQKVIPPRNCRQNLISF